MPLAIDRAKVESPYETTFWGQKYTCEPKFVEEVLGDGMVLLFFTPLNTRPNYYLIRVDSSWHLSNCRTCEDECPDELAEHLDEIYEAIEEEYGCSDERDEEETDEEYESRGWPELSSDSGSCWGIESHPEKYAQEVGDAKA